LRAVVVATGGAGFDVDPVEADRRRAEEAFALRLLVVRDVAQHDLRVDPFALQEGRQAHAHLLVVGAALEVEDLDPHDARI
jgi:hypothetical protein